MGLINLLLFGFGASAATADISIQEVWNLVQTNQVQTLPELLPLLPEEYLNHYTLAYAPRGRQEGSYENPRAILFGKRAKTIFAFNGDPAQIGYDELEMAEFNLETKRVEFRFIQFPSPRNSLTRPALSRLNPPHCLHCHGDNPRFVFDDYFGWPGFYSEFLITEETTQPHYRDFLNLKPTHDRYRHLRTEFSIPPSGVTEDGAYHRPNSTFGKLLAGWQGIRVANDLLGYGKLRPKLYSFLLSEFVKNYGCKNPQYYGENSIAHFAEMQETHFQHTRRLLIEQYPVATHWWAWTRPEEMDGSGHYEVMAYQSPEIFTLKMDTIREISPTVGLGSRDQGLKAEYFDGVETVSMHRLAVLLSSLVLEDPVLAGKLRTQTYIEMLENNGSYAGRYRDGSGEAFDSIHPRFIARDQELEPGQRLCDYLLTRAEAEWN